MIIAFLDELRNLDRRNIGGWPWSIRLFFISAVFMVVLFLGWHVSIANQQHVLAVQIDKETQLKREFAQKQAKVASLGTLQQQLEQMQSMLWHLLRQLPGKTEMPELLIDISQAALSAGLETELFQPGPEARKDFYAEKPIQLRMVGTYHQFGAFISGVAALPQVVILTLHDVSLTPRLAPAKTQASAAPVRLVLQGTVKTYRYLEDDENAMGKALLRPAPPPRSTGR
jgi:type IV pilus assembly protein PilO